MPQNIAITGISGNTIVGYFGDATGTHGFIATGVPEPSNLAMLGLGIPALLGLRRFRRDRLPRLG